MAGLSLAREVRRARVERWAIEVLDGEGAGPTTLSVTFLSEKAMLVLNREVLGHDWSTDVVAFRLEHADRTVGDVYVCPAVARRSARDAGVLPAEEMLRLVVHGTLHVLGYDHPSGPGRTKSPMWSLQEQYVTRASSRES